MTDNGHTWVSVAEASRITGKSERTIRRWMAGGRLATRDGATGLTVGVPSELVADDRHMTGTEEATPDMPDTGARLAELEAELRHWQAEAGKWQALAERVTGEADYLRSALAAALTLQQKALPARAGQPGVWARVRQWVTGAAGGIAGHAGQTPDA